MRDWVRLQFFTDPLFAFNVFFWTYDPRVRPNHLPFLTYPFQDKAILEVVDHIERGEDILIDKSRDMGVSWFITSIYLWFWLRPGPGNDFLMGSRKEPLVDKKGNMDTLFEKCRYNLYKIPDWLVPVGYFKNRHDNYLQLLNPESGCTIEGESTNEHFASAGRYKSTLHDEKAKWGETAKPAWIAAAASTPCRIAVSTPYGMGTHFARLRFSKTTKVVTFHWTKHPLKGKDQYCLLEPRRIGPKTLAARSISSPWYEAECKRNAADQQAISQDLDIDYITSGSPAFSTDYLKAIRILAGERPGRRFNLVHGAWIPNENGRFIVYKGPNPNHQYSIGADTAEGVEGGDYSAAVVLNRNTFSVDAIYHARSSPDHFAFDLMALGYIYGGRDKEDGAILAIETNTIGLGTAIECDNQNYPNLYYHTHEHLANKKVTQQFGWKTTGMTKRVLVSGIESFLFDVFQFQYHMPLEVVDELLTFVVRGTKGERIKYEADSGCNDDLVIALGIALVAHQQSPILPIKKVKMIGPDIVEKDARPAPTVHERCMKSLAQKNRAFIWDEHMGDM